MRDRCAVQAWPASLGFRRAQPASLTTRGPPGVTGNRGSFKRHHACAASAVHASAAPHRPIVDRAPALTPAGRRDPSPDSRESRSRAPRNLELRALAGRDGRVTHVSQRHRHCGLAGKHEVSGQQVVRHAAHRVDVSAPINIRSSERDFRRHVRWRSHRSAVPRQQARGGSFKVLHQSEIEDFDEVVVWSESAEEDVGGLDVAVKETAPVCLAKRVVTCRSR